MNPGLLAILPVAASSNNLASAVNYRPATRIQNQGQLAKAT